MSKALFTITVSPLFAGIVKVFLRPIHTTATLSSGASATLGTPLPTAGITGRPTNLKRKRDEMDNDASDATHCATRATPSPVPTEIDDTMTQAEHIEAAKDMGVKVRDFAYEPSSLAPVPEPWRKPLHTLAVHDRYLRASKHKGIFKLPGKLLWRLIDSGLVTQEEALLNWTQEDREACTAYATRPRGPYPYTMPTVRKPTAEYRRRLCRAIYGAAKDDVPEELIYMPPNTDDMDDGTSEVPGANATMRTLPPEFVNAVSAAMGPVVEEISGTLDNTSVERPAAKKRRVAEHDSSSPTPAEISPTYSEHNHPSSYTHEGSQHSSTREPGDSTGTIPTQAPLDTPAPDALPPPPRPIRRSNLVRTESVIW
ncbi:hypothetical protein EVJ58_g4159 [Rhodofomes roseus]|uniref:Uncharacterized protein n=1 Tax=Rhodofomes roseus TaxID=34475 RepID=A0A4Y9YJJ0_9APHY|nr:hypothetical protein EVJ58_g4159 [Rhodofomes roseus]